jgi:hypothetical protein
MSSWANVQKNNGQYLHVQIIPRRILAATAKRIDLVHADGVRPTKPKAKSKFKGPSGPCDETGEVLCS